jgi:hypothetical protein
MPHELRDESADANKSEPNLKPLNTAISNINTGVEELLDTNVCLICDEFLDPNGLCHFISIDQLRHPELQAFLHCSRVVEDNSGGEIRFEPLPDDVAEFYTYCGNEYGRAVTDAEARKVQMMLLSPRSKFRKDSLKRKTGFMICTSCQYGVKHISMPKYAIANNFYFGVPASCLTDLNEVELALLTPMRTYGYMFTYTGGAKLQMTGSLTYFKLELTAAVEAVAQFDALNVKQNVVIMLHGKLTTAQAKRAYSKSRVRPDMLKTAVKWLIANHTEWRQENYDDTVEKLKKRPLAPELLDTFERVEDSDDILSRELEAQETFDVFYPDGTAVASGEGSSSIAKFDSILQKAKADGYALALRCAQSIGECTSEFNNNNIVNSCLLQFPYGLGGVRAHRYKGDLSTGIMDIHDYIKHLVSVSQPHFHRDVFCLVLYNMYVKHQMLISASFKVRGNAPAQHMLDTLSHTDVELITLPFDVNGASRALE